MDTSTDLTDILTVDQMGIILRRDERSLTEAIERVDQATTTYEQLTRREGQSSDAGHEIAKKDHLPPLVAAEADGARVASASERNARGILGQLTTTATRMVVPAETEAAAATKLPLLARVVDSAPLTQLVAEFRAALVADDTAALYVLASLLPGRLANEAPLGQPTGSPATDEARAEIARLVGRTRDALRDPSLDAIRDQANGVLARAAIARRASEQRRKQADLAARLAAGGRVAWPTSVAVS